MSNRRAFSFFSVLLFLSLSACSLYRSEGRKFLEEQGITFAANGTAAYSWSFKAHRVEEPCAELLEKPTLARDEWSVVENTKTSNADEVIYQTEAPDAFDVLMYLKKDNRHYLCAFYYEDLHSRINQLDQDLNIAYQTIQTLEKH